MAARKTGWQGRKFKKLVPKLGGPTAVAAAIECREATIYNWYTKPKGPDAPHLARLFRLITKTLGWSFERTLDHLLPE